MMKDVRTTVSGPQSAPLNPDEAALTAEVARELLTRPESGVTRISYVGLPEREAVQLIIDARYDGLQARTERGQTGHVSVTLSAPAEAEEAPAAVARAHTSGARAAAPAAPADAPGAREGAWARLRTSGRRLACLLSGGML
ncbi:MAG TPA: hypothetical protein VII06_20120 [Chloroflexota bacterium]|jgi:hypothetical protein